MDLQGLAQKVLGYIPPGIQQGVQNVVGQAVQNVQTAPQRQQNFFNLVSKDPNTMTPDEKNTLNNGMMQMVSSIAPVDSAAPEAIAGARYLRGEAGKFMGSKPILNQAIDQLTAPANLLVSHEGAPSEATVQKYMADILNGNQIDPLKVIREGVKYGIEDGKHRFEALTRLGVNNIPIQLVPGPK